MSQFSTISTLSHVPNSANFNQSISFGDSDKIKGKVVGACTSSFFSKLKSIKNTMVNFIFSNKNDSGRKMRAEVVKCSQSEQNDKPLKPLIDLKQNEYFIETSTEHVHKANDFIDGTELVCAEHHDFIGDDGLSHAKVDDFIGDEEPMYENIDDLIGNEEPIYADVSFFSDYEVPASKVVGDFSDYDFVDFTEARKHRELSETLAKEIDFPVYAQVNYANKTNWRVDAVKVNEVSANEKEAPHDEKLEMKTMLVSELQNHPIFNRIAKNNNVEYSSTTAGNKPDEHNASDA